MPSHLVRTPLPSFTSTNRSVAPVVLLAALLLALPACKEDVVVPLREPDDTGLIAAVGKSVGPGASDREGLLTRIHVKTNPDDPNECGVIYDVFDETGPVTTVLRVREADGRLRPAGVELLTVGAEVRVWHTGDIAESCPAQGTATIVEVVRG